MKKVIYLGIVFLALIVAAWVLANRQTIEASVYIASMIICTCSGLWAIEKASAKPTK